MDKTDLKRISRLWTESWLYSAPQETDKHHLTYRNIGKLPNIQFLKENTVRE